MSRATKRSWLLVSLVLLALIGSSVLPVAGAASLEGAPLKELKTGDKSDLSSEDVEQIMAGLPLRFIANEGQTDPSVHFTVQGAGHTLFFTEEGITFGALAKGEGDAVEQASFQLTFPGAAASPALEGLEQMAGVVNYYRGNDPARWQQGVPTYGGVAYRALYPGIDLVYRGSEGRLKSEFVVAPGVDPAPIVMAYQGLEGLYLAGDGSLVLQTKLGELTEEAPVAYQEVGGKRLDVAARFVLRDGDAQQVGFELGAYDPTHPLVIDPVLIYASYLGGGGGDFSDGANAITTDAAGNVWVTGHTESTAFPTTANAYQPTYPGSLFVAFVTGIHDSGGGVYAYTYSTYLGGSTLLRENKANAITTDASGNIWVTGETNSTDFPTTANALQSAYAGGTQDAFMSRLAPDGSLPYSSYLGGTNYDEGSGIATDAAGNVWVTGNTESTNFPTTANALQPAHAGARNVFITGIRDSGGGVYAYTYSSYLGGTDSDRGFGIATDAAGTVWVTGDTYSTNYPTTANALQPAHAGGTDDAFITGIRDSGGGVYAYTYSSYLGGADNDRGYGIATDAAGTVWVTGQTDTGSTNFPTTANALQPAHAGGAYDAFITGIGDSGGGVYAYIYSSFLGGTSYDQGYGIATDASGNIWVTGYTSSTDFPTTANALQSSPAGPNDAFITAIRDSGGGIYIYAYSSYLGGTNYDLGKGIATDTAGNVWVTGNTESTDFPTTANALQPALASGQDAFIMGLATQLTWTGGGTDFGWATPENWGGYAGSPGASDDVTFDATSSKNAFLGSSAWGWVRNMTMAAGYSGQVTQNRPCRVEDDFNLAAGNFVGGASGELSVGGDFLHSGGNFNPNGGGVVILDGSGAQTVTGTNTFYNLTINNSSDSQVVDASGSSLTVQNLLRVQDGVFISASDLHHVQVDVDGHWQLAADTAISGDWTHAGRFSHNNHVVTLDSGATQNLDASSNLLLSTLIVPSGTTLVEANAADNVAVVGVLDNSGAIRKSQSVAGTGLHTFGLTGVRIDVTGQGSLSKLEVTRTDSNHPNAAGSAGSYTSTGRYWSITPSGSSYTVDVSLPHGRAANHDVTEACRYTGSAWDCARTSSNMSHVTRTGITELSDWAVGGCTDAAMPTSTSIGLDDTDVLLSWDDDAANAGGYEVHRSTVPYFAMDLGTLYQSLPAGSTSTSDLGAAGSTDENYYYIVRGASNCGMPSPYEKCLGEFDHGITPGVN